MTKPKLILVGGAPRCGKSELVDWFVGSHPGWDTVRLDYLRDMMRDSFGQPIWSDELVLDLFGRYRPASAVHFYMMRDSWVAFNAISYLEKLLKHDHDVVCEGLFDPGLGDKFKSIADVLEVHLARKSDCVSDELEALRVVNNSDADPCGSWLAKLSDSQVQVFAEVEMVYGTILDIGCSDSENALFFDMACGYEKQREELHTLLESFAKGRAE